MELEVTVDSTNLSYWLNWRVLLCAIWVITTMIIAFVMMWKYEGRLTSGRGQTEQDVNENVHDNDSWKPCLKQIHPIWLLVFRVAAFCMLLPSLIVKVETNGGVIFYYYTQWTFTLVTIYFGCGSLLSIYGCYQYNKLNRLRFCRVRTDTEQGPYMPLISEESTSILRKKNALNLQEDGHTTGLPRTCNYVFEILFQMNAGAVMLTDCVYWVVIFPFITIKDYNLNFMTVNMHTVNAILLLGDTALNCLRVPLFRIYFFVLWTSVYVIFQWIAHAFVSIGWPYPFLDLSSKYAPLWYLLIGVMHLPCYGIFAFIVKLKHDFLSKRFPSSYQYSQL
ncbi:hypothetical protein FEM48_Zijuj04G0025000 [Ziziphus jujuba var. spinosa]|uniref:Transmembrane protein n=1 Tax=Ziziphus jujuba var. spinosa TaxID=714518 RepID=A0A978VHB7_ZIZJJ|nr:hypothetical protein FEM48_Zijuj04G0025000 [Ziziphus jujuba var. spinosa]